MSTNILNIWVFFCAEPPSIAWILGCGTTSWEFQVQFRFNENHFLVFFQRLSLITNFFFDHELFLDQHFVTFEVFVAVRWRNGEKLASLRRKNQTNKTGEKIRITFGRCRS